MPSIQSSTPSLRACLRLYAVEPLGIRLFVRLRSLLAPLERIAAAVPPQGDVLDVGCGHGLFALMLALAYPRRRVLGVDPSPAKLAVARRVGGGVPNVEFRLGSVEAADGRFQCITILDVLYLLPPEEKRRVVLGCCERLAPGGVLLVKANDTHPAWKYGVARLQEQVMTGLGLTLGSGSLHFYSCRQNAELLRQAGFQVEVVHLGHWSPYPHVLLVARAPDGRPPRDAGAEPSVGGASDAP